MPRRGFRIPAIRASCSILEERMTAQRGRVEFRPFILRDCIRPLADFYVLSAFESVEACGSFSLKSHVVLLKNIPLIGLTHLNLQQER